MEKLEKSFLFGGGVSELKYMLWMLVDRTNKK